MKETHQKPLVSVVTPLYNGERFIASAIESVLAQDCRNYEHLIVDDGSDDSGPEIVRSYEERDKRIHLLKNDLQKGPAGARNTAIRRSAGRYIAFLDCDDVWYENKLSAQIAHCRKTGAALTFSSYDLMSEEGDILSKGRKARKILTYDQLLSRNAIGCLTAMIDSKLAGRPLMPDIRMRQDWGLWLRVLRETGTSAFGLTHSLAALRIRKGSLSRNKAVATYYNFMVLHKHEKVPVAKAVYCVLKHSFGVIGDR